MTALDLGNAPFLIGMCAGAAWMGLVLVWRRAVVRERREFRNFVKGLRK